MALFRKKGLAAKIESSYGVDPTIAEATNSIQHRSLEIVPLDGDFVTRNLDLAVLGAEGEILVSSRCLMNFEVEAAGSGTAGDAPGFGPLLEACGFAETLDPGVDAVYDPVSSSFDSIWLEANQDGVQHVAKGARGNMSLSWAVREIPQFAFSFTGLYQAPTDVVIPSYTLTGFQVPEAFNNANTPTATLLGQTIALESFSIDLQNQIEHRDIIGNEAILLVDRNVRGSISIERPLLATYNWFAAAVARTSGVLQIIHGDTAGNIVTIDAPNVELSNPRYRESQGVVMIDMDMILKPSSGDDEIVLTFA